MGTDCYTPLSIALWDFLEEQNGGTLGTEWLHERLMSEIVRAVQEVEA